MEEVKSVNFFNITKAKNESYQSFLTKLIAIWDDSVYSKTSTSSILKDKILDNVNNDEFRQQILAAKDVDMPKFLALCMSFDSLEVKMDELKMAEDAKILEEKKSESFFLPISEVVLKYLPVRFYKCNI